MMEKKDRKEIFDLFVKAFENQNFQVLSGLNPCTILYNDVMYNVYIKNLTPAQLSNNNPDVWRCQLPKRTIFQEFKDSSVTFILLGYDATNDVYATWNPYWAKQRLNVGESVSMYSRFSIQKNAAENNQIIEFDLNHKGKVIVFPRLYLTKYIDDMSLYFEEETEYKAIGSSLRKNKKIIEVKTPKAPNILIPALIEKLKPIMCCESPDELAALQVLSDYFGNQYNGQMTIKDWIALLESINWNDPVKVNEEPKIEVEKETYKMFYSDFFSLKSAEKDDDEFNNSIFISNRDGFINYMINMGKSPKTIRKYSRELPNKPEIRDFLMENYGISTMYEIEDAQLLTEIHDKIKLLNFDIKGKQMYSCGINQYIKYIKTKNR